MSETTKTDRHLGLKFVSEMLAMPYPESEDSSNPTMAVLRKERCVKVASFNECTRFIAWVSQTYGNYGQGIRVLPDTAADAYGRIGAYEAGCYMRVAKALGWWVEVKAANRAAGLAAVYDVAPFWENAPEAPEPSEPDWWSEPRETLTAAPETPRPVMFAPTHLHDSELPRSRREPSRARRRLADR